MAIKCSRCDGEVRVVLGAIYAAESRKGHRGIEVEFSCFCDSQMFASASGLPSSLNEEKIPNHWDPKEEL